MENKYTGAELHQIMIFVEGCEKLAELNAPREVLKHQMKVAEEYFRTLRRAIGKTTPLVEILDEVK